jgi:hypothetical protein
VPESFALDVFKDNVRMALLRNGNYLGNARMIQFANKRGLASQASGCGAAITKFGVRNFQNNHLSRLDIKRFKDGCHPTSLYEFQNLKPVVKKITNAKFVAQTRDITQFAIKKSLRWSPTACQSPK